MRQVRRLPSAARSATCPPTMPRRPAASATRACAAARGAAGGALGGSRQHGERLGEQRVAGEDRQGLAEDHVAGRPAAAQVVVVHRRQVVVDQRVGVDHLDARRRAACARSRRRPTASHGGEREDRPEPLAAGEQAVAHRLDQPMRMARRRAGSRARAPRRRAALRARDSARDRSQLVVVDGLQAQACRRRRASAPRSVARPRVSRSLARAPSRRPVSKARSASSSDSSPDSRRATSASSASHAVLELRSAARRPDRVMRLARSAHSRARFDAHARARRRGRADRARRRGRPRVAARTTCAVRRAARWRSRVRARRAG